MSVYIVMVEVTLTADDDIEATERMGELLSVYRTIGYIEDWEIVDVEEQ